MEDFSGRLFLSHRLDALLQRLAERLFLDQHPLQRRHIVVPSLLLKQFITYDLLQANAHQVATGFDILLLPEALDLLLERTGIHLLSELELTLLLEQEILTLLQQLPPAAEGLADHLQFDGHIAPPLGNRVQILSEKLATVFSRYGLLGGPRLQEWQAKQGWQQLLWQRIYRPQAPWTYPYRALQQVQAVQDNFYLFGFATLPLLYLDFFLHQGADLFLFSPCAEFWFDHLSTGDVPATHPLLQSLATAGRLLLQDLHAVGWIEDFYPPVTPTSCLGALQESLLQNACPPQSTPPDASLQVHQVTTKRRELEVLQQSLCQLLTDPRQPLEPRDIVVYISNLEEYEPDIHQAFSSPELPIPFTIFKAHNGVATPFGQALFDLLDLPEQRFAPAALRRLLENPLFNTSWSAQEVAEIFGWLEQVAVLWGIDAQQRQELLLTTPATPQTEVATWQQALDRLLFAMALPAEEAEWVIDAADRFDGAAAQQLGAFYALLLELRRDLAPLSTGAAYSGSAWMGYLQQLIDKYLQATESKERLQHDLAALIAKLGQTAPLNWDYRTVRQILEQLLCQQSTSPLLPENSVRFLPYVAGTVYPATVIAVLGLDGQRFPRLETISSLDEITGQRGSDPHPLLQQQDRYLFLHTLLAAKKKLLFFFSCRCQTDGHERPPSPILQELIDFASSHFGIAPIEHPHCSFDPSYFQAAARWRSPSLPAYRAAIAVQQKKQRPQIVAASAPAPAASIEVAKLLRCARHPLRFYLQEALGLHLQPPPTALETEFSLSPYQRAILLRRALDTSPAAAIAHSKASGDYPAGLWGEQCRRALTGQVERITDACAQLGIAGSDRCTISWTAQVAQPRREGKEWKLPPLQWSVGGAPCTIVGKLYDVLPSGLLLLGKKSPAQLIANWPRLLLLSWLVAQGYVAHPTLYFLPSGEKMTLSLPLELFSPYLAHYQQSRQMACPLLPGWVPALRAASAARLEKELERAWHPVWGDLYVQWLFESAAAGLAEQLVDRFAAPAQQLFAPLEAP